MAENRIKHGRKRQASVSVGMRRKVPFRERQQSSTKEDVNNQGYGHLQKRNCGVGPRPWTAWTLENLHIEEHLGKGGFADVYRVRDKRSGHLYALKHQKMGADDTEEELEFESEILSNLSHPNIVRCYGTFRTELTTNLVLEYCEKGNLYEVMSSTSEKLTNEIARHYTVNIVDGLMHLHTKMELIHMDLKPENILVTHNVAKISDLGCAVKMEGTRHVMNRHNGGTAVYRPPEMFHGEGFDSTADVWALGCIAFEMQFRRHPFFPKLWLDNFSYNEDEEEKALREMDRAQREGLFSKSPKCKAALRSLLEMILASKRQYRPVIADVKNSSWIRVTKNSSSPDRFIPEA